MKGDEPILQLRNNPGVVVEGGGIYKEYEYLITFIEGGHRCGYVAIDQAHPCFGKNLIKSSDFDIRVHGGITFHNNDHSAKRMLETSCTDEWLGFDAAHGEDLGCVETLNKYFSNSEYAKYRLENPFQSFSEQAIHRSYDYMEQECKDLIDQLIEIKDAA
jgi:hypothetical protein